MLSQIFVVCVVTLTLLYVILTEGVDWPARIEYLELKHPRLATWLRKFAEKRWLRFVLLVVCMMLLSRNILELREKHPEDSKTCWHYVAWDSGVPENYTKQGAKWATEVLLVCNYELDRPLSWKLEFDKPLIGGFAWIPGDTFFVGGSQVQGNNFVGGNSLNLPPEHILKFTIYASEQIALLKFKVGDRQIE